MNDHLSNTWKILFLLAALFNLGAGGFGMAFPALGMSFTTGLETTEPAVLSLFFVVSLIVALFGFGYLLVAFNPSANRGLVVVGALSKFCLPVLTCYGYLSGVATLGFTVLAGGDIVWAGLFTYYLKLSKE